MKHIRDIPLEMISAFKVSNNDGVLGYADKTTVTIDDVNESLVVRLAGNDSQKILFFLDADVVTDYNSLIVCDIYGNQYHLTAYIEVTF